MRQHSTDPCAAIAVLRVFRCRLCSRPAWSWMGWRVPFIVCLILVCSIAKNGDLTAQIVHQDVETGLHRSKKGPIRSTRSMTGSKNCWYAWQTAMYLLNTYLCQQSLEGGLRSSVARFPLPATRRQLHLQSIAVEAERALVVAAAISAASHKQRRGGANTEDAIISTSFSHDYGQEQSTSA